MQQYVLTMRPGTADILPGLKTPILGYEGLYPGPTIKATRGRAVEIRQINQSGRSLNVHLHGGVTRPEFDGHPHDAIPHGTERLYKYPNVQRQATLWYHDHAHGETAQTLYAGLSAFYLLDDPADAELDLPQGAYDVPLMIQDRSFNADGSFRYRVDLDRGFRGDTILVNGAVAPRMKVERRKYRLRFLNAANARAFTLALGNNRAMTQIGSEGGLLTKPVRRATIPLEPAERADVVIDFRAFGAGSKVILHNVGGEATTQAIMRFDVVRGGTEEARVPKVLAEEEPLPVVNARRGWPLTFQGLGTSMWQIASGGFDELRIDCRPRQGSTELWTWTNTSPRTHPMHLHGYHFRIVTRTASRRTGGCGLEGHGRGVSQPGRRGAAVLRLLPRALRVPLPCRRARRHVDDGPDGGGRVIAALRPDGGARGRPVHGRGAGRQHRDRKRLVAARPGAKPGDTVEWRLVGPATPRHAP